MMIVLQFLLLGTTHGRVPNKTDFDCPMRRFVLAYAARVQPSLSSIQLQHIADALNGAEEIAPGCHIDVPSAFATDTNRRTSRFKVFPLPEDNTPQWFVDPLHGKDSNPGTKQAPFATITTAIKASRATTHAGQRSIILRQGTHRVSPPGLLLGPADSGLRIQAYPGEEAWMSGGTQLPKDLAWTPVSFFCKYRNSYAHANIRF